jgi:hypothetical protein
MLAPISKNTDLLLECFLSFVFAVVRGFGRRWAEVVAGEAVFILSILYLENFLPLFQLPMPDLLLMSDLSSMFDLLPMFNSLSLSDSPLWLLLLDAQPQ